MTEEVESKEVETTTIEESPTETFDEYVSSFQEDPEDGAEIYTAGSNDPQW
jgi:hypothetical protein